MSADTHAAPAAPPAPVPSARPLRRDAARNRMLLLAAADSVLSEQGLDAGVEEIAARAGVGIGTLYRRFPDKESLIAELVQGLLDDLLGEARAALARADGTGLELFLRAAGKACAEHRGCLPRMMDKSRDRATATEIRELSFELLVDAKAHGTVADYVQPSDVSATIWAIRGIVEVSGTTAPEAWRRYLDIHLAALRTDGNPTQETPVPTEMLAVIADRR